MSDVLDERTVPAVWSTIPLLLGLVASGIVLYRYGHRDLGRWMLAIGSVGLFVGILLRAVGVFS